jgi:hypothetical protein
VVLELVNLLVVEFLGVYKPFEKSLGKTSALKAHARFTRPLNGHAFSRKPSGMLRTLNFLTVHSAGLPLTKSLKVIPKLGVNLLIHC